MQRLGQASASCVCANCNYQIGRGDTAEIGEVKILVVSNTLVHYKAFVGWLETLVLLSAVLNLFLLWQYFNYSNGSSILFLESCMELNTN